MSHHKNKGLVSIGLNKKIIETVNAYIAFLKENYSENIIKIIMFGSAARRKRTRESDVDLLIITTNKRQSVKDEISMSAFDIMLKNNIVLSPIVMDKETYEWYRKYRDPFYNNIMRDGVDIWTKKPERSLKSV
jgi:predicted nucleotidyltransferase